MCVHMYVGNSVKGQRPIQFKKWTYNTSLLQQDYWNIILNPDTQGKEGCDRMKQFPDLK